MTVAALYTTAHKWFEEKKKSINHSSDDGDFIDDFNDKSSETKSSRSSTSATCKENSD